MKKVLFFYGLLLSTLSSFSQTDTLRQQLDSLFGNLSPIAIPSGYLAPYGMDMAQRQRFNGVLTDSNVINNMDVLRLLYADVYTARFSSTSPTLITVDSLNNKLGVKSNKLGIFYGQLSDINENALVNNELTYSGGRLYDVSTRTTSPYLLKNVFAAYPNNRFFKRGRVTLELDSSLFFTNTTTGLQSVQVDFGHGYQTLQAGTPLTKIYTDSTGEHIITLKATLNNSEVYYTKMVVWVDTAGHYFSGARLAVYADADLGAPDIDIQKVDGVHSGALIYIRRSVTTPSNQLLKPLIVVEGLDMHSIAPELQDNYDVNILLRDWRKVTFNSNRFDFNLDDVAGYDIVFVDWKNGTDDITRNAALLQDIIGRVNTMKAGSSSTEQNVVMGISMGGLVARYCLASMTKNSVPHDTRLLITHDSPHQGAYIPLSFQHLVLGLQNKSILGVRLGSAHKGELDQAVALLKSSAAQQQLILTVTDDDGTVANNTFLATTYRDMITFPGTLQPTYGFIATANGSQCGVAPLPIGASLVVGSAEANLSGVSYIFTRSIIAKWKYYFEVDAKGLTGTTNSKIIHALLQRKQRLFAGVIKNNRTIMSIDWFEPTNNSIPWESVPGGVESLAERLGSTNSIQKSWNVIANWFLGYEINFTLASRFSFVPVVSALDVNRTLNHTAVFDSYIGSITPPGVSRANEFIAQEAFGTGLNVQYNQPHTTFTDRNANWLFDRMENNSSTLNCSVECPSSTLKVEGSAGLCTTGSWGVYVNGQAYVGTINWSASPSNVVALSSTSGNPITLTRQGDGVVVLTANFGNLCGSSTNIISTKHIQLGTDIATFNIEPYIMEEPDCYEAWGIYTFTATIATGENDGGIRWGYRIVGTSIQVVETYDSQYYTLIPEQAGTYEIFVVTTNECGLGSLESVKTIDVLNSCPLMMMSPINTYPNPASNEVTVSFTEQNENSNTSTTTQRTSQTSTTTSPTSTTTIHMQLLNAGTGALARTWNLPSGQSNYRLNLAGVSNGHYLLKITKGTKTYTKKLIIAK